MQILAVFAGIIALVLLYFFIGIVLKFIWGWWIPILAVPIAILLGLHHGWLGAIGCVAALVITIPLADGWQDTSICRLVDRLIDKAFYFEDV